MYANKSFKSKKALKEAVAAGAKVGVFQPNDMFNTPIPVNGTVSIEGPNFVMHTWYARVTITDGYITKVS